jgi:hypothetical protein
MRSFFSIAAKVFEFNQVEDQRPDFFKSTGLLNLAPYRKKGVILFLEAERVRHLAPCDFRGIVFVLEGRGGIGQTGPLN